MSLIKALNNDTTVELISEGNSWKMIVNGKHFGIIKPYNQKVTFSDYETITKAITGKLAMYDYEMEDTYRVSYQCKPIAYFLANEGMSGVKMQRILDKLM